MHCSTSCTAQAGFSTGTRPHLLHAVVRLCGEFISLVDGQYLMDIAFDK
jgi:hypothetical protein